MTITYGEGARITDVDLVGKVCVATLKLQWLGTSFQDICLLNYNIVALVFAL